MFKKFLVSLIPLLFLLAIGGSAQATTIVPDYPYPDPNGSKTHDQYYSVVFDGEGEAAVIAKLNIVNRTSRNLNTINLDIPAKSLRLINAVQGISARPCVRYDYSVRSSPICTQYGTSYYSTNYYTLKPEIQKLKNVYSLTINLKRPIEPQGSSGILLHYKATGYVKSALDLYNFSFETIKESFDVDNVRVAINVQEGFRIKGGSAKTNYAPNFATLSSEKSFSGGADASLQAFSSRIVKEVGFVRQTQSLDPGENFVVKGTYSSSLLFLYLQDIIKILVIATLVLLIVWVFYKRWKARNQKAAASIHPLVQVFGMSLTSITGLIAISVLGLWVLGRVATGSNGLFNVLVVLLILLLLLIFAVSLIFGPAIYFGVRKGLLYGAISVGISVVILILFTIILLVVLGVPGAGPMIVEPLY